MQDKKEKEKEKQGKKAKKEVNAQDLTPKKDAKGGGGGGPKGQIFGPPPT
jgi:hypothetical protein